MSNFNFIPSVNYHLWRACNMRCKFCFASFQDVKSTILPKGHLSYSESQRLIKGLADFGFRKITFAGGEPTLCPWLSELIKDAKTFGLTTMIVTNGSALSNQFLRGNQRYLDWITLSIDSLSIETNLKSGRISRTFTTDESNYLKLISNIKKFRYRLKINTVVSRLNLNDDLNDFINIAEPDRWKIVQAIPIKGQNDGKINDIMISNQEFNEFVQRHNNHECVVPETNNQIINSYVMVDPAGRFFTNENGYYRYTKPILDVGVKTAISEMNYDLLKFTERGGIYQWE